MINISPKPFRRGFRAAAAFLRVMADAVKAAREYNRATRACVDTCPPVKPVDTPPDRAHNGCVQEDTQ